jgi:hypothetical protein
MGVVLAVLSWWLAPGAGLAGVALLGLICTLGAASYFAVAQATGGVDLRDLRRLVRRKA